MPSSRVQSAQFPGPSPRCCTLACIPKAFPGLAEMHGKQVADFVVFISCLLLIALYHVYYFCRGFLPGRGRHNVLDLWTTAMKTRTLWADDVMHKAENPQGEALLAVQTLRNIVLAASLLVMGMSQIMGRLVTLMTTQAQLDTLESFVRQDPITDSDGSFAPAYVRVAVAFGFTLLSLLSFAQCVRLAVHLGFCIRVKGVHRRTDMPLREEIIVMTERCSLCFTLGLRFLYGFIAFVWWGVGTTPLLVATCVVVLALLFSDQIPARDFHGEHPRHLAKSANKYKKSYADSDAYQGDPQDGALLASSPAGAGANSPPSPGIPDNTSHSSPDGGYGPCRAAASPSMELQHRTPPGCTGREASFGTGSSLLQAGGAV